MNISVTIAEVVCKQKRTLPKYVSHFVVVVVVVVVSQVSVLKRTWINGAVTIVTSIRPYTSKRENAECSQNAFGMQICSRPLSCL